MELEVLVLLQETVAVVADVGVAFVTSVFLHYILPNNLGLDNCEALFFHV